MGGDNKVMNLLAEYTRLRQSGYSRDEAWEKIQPQADSLSQKELGRLLSLLRGWEAREGRQYKPSREDPYETMHKPPEGLEEVRQQMNDSSKRNVIRRISPPDQPQPSAAQPQPVVGHPQPPAKGEVVCPSCHKMNRASEIYCYSCGTLLVQAGATQQIGGTQKVESDEQSDAHFAEGMVLYLQVRGTQQPLRVMPRADEMVIGRRSPDSVMIPDIDLSPYQADSLGVSRLHAGLKRQNNTLILTDMGSLNHTYINGQRLHPHEVRVLHNNDELRFGQLVARVYFRRE